MVVAPRIEDDFAGFDELINEPFPLDTLELTREILLELIDQAGLIWYGSRPED